METPPITPIDDCLIHYDANGTLTTGLKDLWRGCSGMLIGGGPSINSIDYMKLAERGVCSLGINAIAAKVPCRAMTFSDPPTKFPEAIFKDPAIIKLVPKRKLARGETRRKLQDGSLVDTGKHAKDYPNTWGYEDTGVWEPSQFLTSPSASFGSNRHGVNTNGRPKIIFTFFSALRLMHFLGCRRVYLLGVDFFMDAKLGVNGNYAFKDERFSNLDPAKAAEEAAGVVHGNNSHYSLANEMLTELRPYLEAAGFQVFNVNPWSRLRAFDHIPWEDALADCRNGIPPGEIDTVGWYSKNKR